MAESPSPDTKLRVDCSVASEPGEDDEPGADRHTVQVEAGHAFAPSLSVEVDVPYTRLDRDRGVGADRLDT